MSGARQGRRRRILQEEVLSASREMSAYAPEDGAKPESGEGRRYAFTAGSLGGALAKRHFPTHPMVPIAMIAGSVLAVVVLVALHENRAAIGSVAGDQALALVDATSPTSLASWTASAAMIAFAVLATMILAVRRRRVDDYRGRHRLWRGAIFGATLLSIDAATNLHTLVADGLSTATGVRLMAGGAEWWLALGGLMFGWVSVRVLVDTKESKFALAAFALAAVAGGVAVVGPIAASGGASASMVASLAQVAAYLLATSALVAYMRFLRQDVTAGVATKPQKSRTTEVKLARATTQPKVTRDVEKDSDDDQPTTRRSKPKRAKQEEAPAASSSQWTDGSDGYSEDYGDEAAPRKLSKSERKRLRQQKASRRAA